MLQVCKNCNFPAVYIAISVSYELAVGVYIALYV